MKTKLLVLLLAASVAGNVAFAVTTVVARRQRAALPMDRLGLDAAQRSQLMATREQFVGDRSRAHARMATLRDALAAEVTKATPDRARMTQITTDIAGIQAEMRPKLIGHLLDMHALLRPEQRGKLAEVLRHGGVGGAGMHGCPGASLFPASAPSEGR
jgi:Spy/CpxP family protein refolding chaperone